MIYTLYAEKEIGMFPAHAATELAGRDAAKAAPPVKTGPMDAALPVRVGRRQQGSAADLVFYAYGEGGAAYRAARARGEVR